MNKYLLYGYFGGWNSGDEAILESIRLMISRRQPNASVVVACPSVRAEYASSYAENGVTAIGAKDLLGIWRLLMTHRLLVGGGQMLTGDRNPKGLLYLWWLCCAARLCGHRASLIGIGVEGVNNPRAKFLVRRIASLCEQIGCRDAYSRQMLLDAGCPENKLQLTADVVFSSVLQLAQPSVVSRPVAIGLHRSPIRSYADETFYIDMIESLRAKMPDREIVVVSNDSREDFDAGLLDRLKQKVLDPKVRWQQFESLDSTLACYATAACVISVRMHPLILALIHGVNVVGIAKSNKVKALADRVGFAEYNPEEMSPEDLALLVEEAVGKKSSPSIEGLSELSWANLKGSL